MSLPERRGGGGVHGGGTSRKTAEATSNKVAGTRIVGGGGLTQRGLGEKKDEHPDLWALSQGESSEEEGGA